MYSLISAIVVDNNGTGNWTETDLSNMPVQTIYYTFSKVFLTLSNPYITNNVYVDFDVFKTHYSGFTGTISDLLISLNDATIETVPSLPNTRVNYVKFFDAFRSRYHVEIGNVKIAPGTTMAPGQGKDIVITRPTVETVIGDIDKYCLTTVNGFVYNTETDGVSHFVIDGNTSTRMSKQNTVGFISFREIGTIKKIPIDPNKVFKQADDATLYQRTYFQVDEDFTNKSVMLVMGGYLIPTHQDIFFPSGERTFGINWSLMNPIEKYFESKEYVDLSYLGLDQVDSMPETINVPELISDEVILKWLTLSQSFLVVIDTPNLFFNKQYVKSQRLPNMFIAYKEPIYPLFLGYGRMAEYWKTYEDQFWAVNVGDSYFDNYVFTYNTNGDLQNVNNNRLPNDRARFSKAFLLEIGNYAFA